MGVEIERKFLVCGNEWRALAESMSFCQGYLNSDKERTVRVRIAGEAAQLTIKGVSSGALRSEFEYEIPLEEAQELLELCERPLIEKNRAKIPFGDVVWEVDEFLGDNAGLVVAEVELEAEDQTFEIPPWIGEEVTGDARYFNSRLVKEPFSTWCNT